MEEKDKTIGLVAGIGCFIVIAIPLLFFGAIQTTYQLNDSVRREIWLSVGVGICVLAVVAIFFGLGVARKSWKIVALSLGIPVALIPLMGFIYSVVVD